MKKVRKILKKSPLCMGCFCLIFLSISCSTRTEALNENSFSGEDYVRGIFFADGPVAEKIPIISNNFDIDYFLDGDQESINKLVEYREEIIQSLNKDLIKSFKNDIESGNHFIIQSSMMSMGKEIKNIIESKEPVLFAVINNNESELFKIIELGI